MELYVFVFNYIITDTDIIQCSAFTVDDMMFILKVANGSRSAKQLEQFVDCNEFNLVKDLKFLLKASMNRWN